MALALAMQKWVDNLAKEWVEYLFLAMAASAQCEGTLKARLFWLN